MKNLGNKFKLIPGGVTAPLGFKAAGIRCGLKKKGKDLALITSSVPARATATLTTNKIKAGSLLASRENLKRGKIQAILINSGNANCATGKKGITDAKEIIKTTAHTLGIKEKSVIFTSTGVIGVPLPVELIKKGIRLAYAKLTRDGSSDAALAIMTTDKVQKEISISLEVKGVEIKIGGIAKGSGMICPQMATMLAFITTDANISTNCLRRALKLAVDKSFNAITVDGDTSPSDMVVLMANGQANNEEIKTEDKEYLKFQHGLEVVCGHLAQEIVKDGEGATKLIKVIVKNALTTQDAKEIALTIAKSNLVKTAIFGADANWGRIINAVGYSKAKINPERIDIYLGKIKVAENGSYMKFEEKKVKNILHQKEVEIVVDLKVGRCEFVVLTCDLTYDYIKINAEYRT